MSWRNWVIIGLWFVVAAVVILAASNGWFGPTVQDIYCENSMVTVGCPAYE